MNINLIQIAGLVLLVVGLVKLIYLYTVLKKGFRTSGRLVSDKKSSSKSTLSNHPRIEFENQKRKKLVLPLKVSKSFVQIHSKDGRIELIYYEGRIFHPKETEASYIIPAIGSVLLLLGQYF